MKRWIALTAVSAAMLVTARLDAQAPSAPATSHPDVLAIIYQQAGKGDLVDITYAHTIPHVQAQRDLDALAQASGWAVGPGRVSDGQPPVQNKIGPMTSSVLTIPKVIQDETHTLPVAPFVTAFRAYKRLTLIFSVAPDFQFQGPHAYADTNVRIGLNEHSPVYTYQIEILNSQLGPLNLPQSQGTATPVRRSSPWPLLLGVLAAAVAAGAVVYALMARASRPARGKDNTRSEEKTTLGTKG